MEEPFSSEALNEEKYSESLKKSHKNPSELLGHRAPLLYDPFKDPYSNRCTVVKKNYEEEEERDYLLSSEEEDKRKRK